MNPEPRKRWWYKPALFMFGLALLGYTVAIIIMLGTSTWVVVKVLKFMGVL